MLPLSTIVLYMCANDHLTYTSLELWKFSVYFEIRTELELSNYREALEHGTLFSGNPYSLENALHNTTTFLAKTSLERLCLEA